MMNGANIIGWNLGFTFLWGLHILSVTLFFAGVFFLLYWAVKHLSGTQLKQWGWGLVIIGTILCLLTIAGIGRPWTTIGMSRGGVGMMMNATLNDDDDNFMMKRGMSMMLQGKTGDNFDRAFIQMMIPHHQGAIDMAELALENAKHEEMKQLARDIIEAQQREIDMMKEWQKNWGYTQ